MYNCFYLGHWFAGVSTNSPKCGPQSIYTQAVYISAVTCFRFGANDLASIMPDYAHVHAYVRILVLSYALHIVRLHVRTLYLDIATSAGQ